MDDIFNDYVVKQGTVQPYFTQYCSGTTVTCEGLSQWGTVSLAEQGLVPYEILQRYYGDDINIVFDAPVTGPIPSYPGVPLRLGDASEEVRIIQRQLNRIGDNYPAIPKIPETNGFFNVPTEEAVKTFQSIFGLTPVSYTHLWWRPRPPSPSARRWKRRPWDWRNIFPPPAPSSW